MGSCQECHTAVPQAWKPSPIRIKEPIGNQEPPKILMIIEEYGEMQTRFSLNKELLKRKLKRFMQVGLFN